MVANDVQIREAVIGDAECIVRFNCALAMESESIELDPQRVRKGVEKALTTPGLGRYFIAERRGLPAGQLMITQEWSDWRARLFWWIQSVYVHPDHRRRGIYRALCEHVHQLAREDPEVCGLRMYAARDNATGLAAHQQLGFEICPHHLLEIDWSGLSHPDDT